MLNRKWVGIDVAVQAMHVVRDRLRHHFPGIEYEVFGVPKSAEGAKYLAANHPFKFEEWAVSRVGAMHSGKFRGDGGIDGSFYFLTGKDDEKSRGIISVKGGKTINPAMIRELRGTVERERVRTRDPKAIGVFICATPPTRKMLEEAQEAGKISTDFGDYPAIQILSVADIFDGGAIRVPFKYDSISAAQASRRRGKTSDYIDPRELVRQRQFFFDIPGGKALEQPELALAQSSGRVMPERRRKVG